MIAEVQKDLQDGIDSAGKKMTLYELYQKQNINRSNVKLNTEKGRKYLMKILKNDKLGNRAIDTIKLSDAKEWALRMKEMGYVYKTINNYKHSLKALYYLAMQDDYVRKNPFIISLSDVIEDDTKVKEALTEEQEKEFLQYVRNDITYQKYYDEVLVLLKTGLRISELCGLTLSDIDFEKGMITIDHQLLYDTKLEYYIAPPKTKSGERQVPMSEETKQILQRLIEQRKNVQPMVIDGYRDFIFLNKKGLPKTAGQY
jgi:integrase